MKCNVARKYGDYVYMEIEKSINNEKRNISFLLYGVEAREKAKCIFYEMKV